MITLFIIVLVFTLVAALIIILGGLFSVLPALLGVVGLLVLDVFLVKMVTKKFKKKKE